MTQRGLARIAFVAVLACVLVVFPGKGFRHSVEQKQKHTPTRGFFHAQASVTVAPAHATRETDRSGSMWVQLVQVLPRDRWALHETTSFSWALGTDRGPPAS